jgi:transcriptional coactivator HFI1/ADA1
VAPWVVATDKPTTATKNAGATGANDKAEERLKKEVLAIHARDRRRIKTLKETAKPTNDGLVEMQGYRHELAVKPPDIAPQSAGGLQRTNWDIEIRRRYAQTLAEETLEFPTQSDVQNRIEPICYEEGLVGGCASGALQQCAELMEEATEVFLKEMLSNFYAHTRSNGEGCIQTNGFKRQFRKEEVDADRGTVQRSAAGFLPVEMGMQADREALSMQDLHLALQLSDTYMKQDTFLSHRVLLNRYPQATPDPPKVNGIFAKPTINGTLARNERNGTGDAMAIDEPEVAWRGATKADVLDLRNVLEDCLTVG